MSAIFNRSILDFLYRINDAIVNRRSKVRISNTSSNIQMLKVLVDRGFINNFYFVKDKRGKGQLSIMVNLKYIQNRCAFDGFLVLSEPSTQIYHFNLQKFKHFSFYKNKIYLISTSQFGIISSEFFDSKVYDDLSEYEKSQFTGIILCQILY